MIIGVHDLMKYSIQATDGEIGSLDDIYFDDHEWNVRYLVIDTSSWLGAGRRVLIDPRSAGAPDLAMKMLPLHLTQERIRNSPPTDFDRPVSEQHQAELYNYYDWPLYWGGSLIPTSPYPFIPAGVYETPPTPTETAKEKEVEGRKADPHLRSVGHVSGYHIRARDGELGHVEDFLIDVDAWAVRYMLVNTRNWLPGRRVLVAPGWIERIDWMDAIVVVNLTRDEIKASPEHDPKELLTRDYEERVHEHYRREGYWKR